MKVLSIFCGLAVFALAAGCGQSSGITGSNAAIPEGVVLSALGYRVKVVDYQGPATQAHADLADQWWTELMDDLRSAGYSEERTDPTKRVAWVYIFLHEPRDSDHSIVCPSRNDLVGGCYDQFTPAFRVPGTYINGPMLGRRPAAQALKHEMLHHWCVRNFKHLCQDPNKSEWEGHIWPAPNDPTVNIWNYTWH